MGQVHLSPMSRHGDILLHATAPEIGANLRASVVKMFSPDVLPPRAPSEISGEN